MGGVSIRVKVRFRVRVREGDKNGGKKDCTEGKEGWERWRGGKNNKINQTVLPYVNV